MVFSWNLDPHVIRAAAAAGARGYLSKDLDGEAIVEALELVHDGGLIQPQTGRAPDLTAVNRKWPGHAVGLNERESEIVLLISRGLNNGDIAEQMFLSINTIKRYIRSAYAKTGVTSRTEAVLWAIDNGFRDDLFQPFGAHR